MRHPSAVTPLWWQVLLQVQQVLAVAPSSEAVKAAKVLVMLWLPVHLALG
jgi:hypothetical protein